MRDYDMVWVLTKYGTLSSCTYHTCTYHTCTATNTASLPLRPAVLVPKMQQQQQQQSLLSLYRSEDIKLIPGTC